MYQFFQGAFPLELHTVVSVRFLSSLYGRVLSCAPGSSRFANLSVEGNCRLDYSHHTPDVWVVETLGKTVEWVLQRGKYERAKYSAS